MCLRDKPKSIFGIHDPIGLKHLIRLHLGLSHLRYDKHRHNFADTISDICECNIAPENVNHFIFICPFYNDQRTILINYVSSILRVHPEIDVVNIVALFVWQ